MSGEMIATRYARALYELASTPEVAQNYLDQLTEIVSVFEDKSISRVLRSPVIDPSVKQAVLAELSRQVKGDDYLSRFLQAVTSAKRVASLPMISIKFKKLIHEKFGIQEATVVTAVALGATDLEEVRKKIESLSSKKILLTSEVDPSILGGFLIRIENSVLDMSLKSMLDAITQTAAS